MTKRTKITTASILFLAVVSLHIYGVLFSEKLAFSSKPFLMTTLLIVYLVSIDKPDFWFISALFFSFWGDVLLLFNEQFFVFGLGCFLIAHIFYIKLCVEYINKTSFKKLALVCFPFLLYLSSFFYVIKDGLDQMQFPLVVYGIVICSFGIVALLNYIQNKSTDNLWLSLGAIIFIVSDSLIAINKFYAPSERYQFLIMITYIVAQYLICKSMIVKTVSQE